MTHQQDYDGYLYGWHKGEVTGLTWDKADWNQGVLRLDPGETKNDQAREIYLNEECLRDITLLFATRRNCRYIFHRHGQKIGNFRKAWHTACKKVGISGRIFHDLRRTAVLNPIRSGVPERVAMQITGHRTSAVFDRYNIVSREDLRKATERLDNYVSNYVGPKMVAGETGQLTASA